MDLEQTAPIGAVWLGSIVFTSINKKWPEVHLNICSRRKNQTFSKEKKNFSSPIRVQNVFFYKLNKIGQKCIWIYAADVKIRHFLTYLLIHFRSLNCKQYGPRSDCSLRSSLIRIHSVCFYKQKWSEADMPYLTLWDKILQNLALLKAHSHKIYKSHRIFRPSKNTFYKEIIINHTLLCLSHVLK